MPSIDQITKELEKKFEKPRAGPKIDWSFQEIGVEMQKVYGKKVWSLFYKYPEGKIREAWKVAQKRKILSFNYLIGIINNLK